MKNSKTEHDIVDKFKDCYVSKFKHLPFCML